MDYIPRESISDLKTEHLWKPQPKTWYPFMDGKNRMQMSTNVLSTPTREDAVPAVRYSDLYSSRGPPTKAMIQAAAKSKTGPLTFTQAVTTGIISSPQTRPRGYGLFEDDNDSDEDHRGHQTQQQPRNSHLGRERAAETIDVNTPTLLMSHIEHEEKWAKEVKADEQRKVLLQQAETFTRWEEARRRERELEETAKFNLATAELNQRLERIKLETQASMAKREQECNDSTTAMWKRVDSAIALIKAEQEAAEKARLEAEEQARKEEEARVKAAQEAEKRRKEAEAKAAKDAEDRKKAEEKEAADKAAKDAADAAATAKRLAEAEGALRASQQMNISQTAEADWKPFRQMMDNIKQSIVPAVLANKPLKTKCFYIKVTIKPRIIQVVNTRQNVIDVATAIDKVLKDAQGNELMYIWLMNFTAKEMVKQAGAQFGIKYPPAFPLAHVAVLLFQSHPMFMTILLARLLKNCPYVAPMYINFEEKDTADTYLKRMRYKKISGAWEKEDNYDERMCGMMALYFAIMQTSPPIGQNIFGLSHAWTWLARTLNMPPRPITPKVLSMFLDIVGPSYVAKYGYQAQKVIQLLARDYLSIMPESARPSAVRVQNQLQTYIQSGRFPIPDGREFNPPLVLH